MSANTFLQRAIRKYILNVWEKTFYRGRKPQPVSGKLKVHTEPGDLKELINPTVYRKQVSRVQDVMIRKI